MLMIQDKFLIGSQTRDAFNPYLQSILYVSTFLSLPRLKMHGY